MSAAATATSLPATQPEFVHAIIQHLDKHLAIPLLQFCIEHPSDKALVPQYTAALKSLASKTYRFDLRKRLIEADSNTSADEKAGELDSLQCSEDFAKSMLRSAAQAAQCLVQEFFTYDKETESYAYRHSLKEMDDRARQTKFSLPAIKRLYGATERHVNELVVFGNTLSDFGRYREAAMVLDLHKRCVTPRYKKRDAVQVDGADADQDEGYAPFASADAGASWGRFALALLLGNVGAARDAAGELVARLDAYDSAESAVVAQHTWFTHWHLYMLATGNNLAASEGAATPMRTPTMDLLWLLYRDRKPSNFLKFRYTNTILCACPHLTPYVVAAAVLNKSNAMMVQRATRIVEVDKNRLRDPLSKFIAAVRIDCDFDAASKLIAECERFMQQDFFLHKHAARFAVNAELMVCQNQLMVHRVMSTEKTGEMPLVRLIREANVDATIDSVSSTLHVHTLTQRTVWKQVLDTLSYVSAN